MNFQLCSKHNLTYLPRILCFIVTFTAKTRNVFNFLSTYVAKLPFDNCPIRPCVSNGVLLIRNEKVTLGLIIM